MTENWIIPCNLKKFNVIEHFKNTNVAVWKNSFSISNGDYVYIYIGSPISEIRYRCRVISDSVGEDLLSKHKYAIVESQPHNFYSKKIKYIEIEKIEEYPEGLLGLKVLRQHGLGQVQIQARTDRKLQKFLNEMEIEIGGDLNG